MPSLEQIIRPFVVDPTTPPVPVVTTLNKPPPDPVRLNIGIGGTSLSSLSHKVAPIIPPKPTTTKPTKPPTIQYKTLSSSYSLAATWYMTGVVREQASADDGGGGGGGGASAVSDTAGANGGSQGGSGDSETETIKFPSIPGGGELEHQFFGRPYYNPSIPVFDPAPAGNPPAPSSGGPVGGTGGSP